MARTFPPIWYAHQAARRKTEIEKGGFYTNKLGEKKSMTARGRVMDSSEGRVRAAKKWASENVVGIDSMRGGKGGQTLLVRGTYFYRHGMDSNKFAQKMFEKFNAPNSPFAGKTKIKNSRDNWQPWPKDSYFEVELSFD